MKRAVERYLAATFLLACLALGGASGAGVIANATLQLLATAVIAGLFAGGMIPVLGRPAMMLLGFIGLLAAVMLLQLIPMPMALWSALPGRTGIARGFALAAAGSPWLPISLAPDATIAALLALLPPLAMMLTIFSSSGYGRVYAIYLLVLFAILSTALGLIQQSGGLGSPFYPYAITNLGSAVGLFANRNHLATLLLATIPFVAALAVSPSRRGNTDLRIGRRLVAGAIVGVLTIGVVSIRSDAGWLLLIPAMVAGTIVFRRGERKTFPVILLYVGAGVICAAVAIVNFAPSVIPGSGDKFDGSSQRRNVTITTTLKAARDYLPTGSGGGTFPTVYPSYEHSDDASDEYINHAHGDYAELFLEYGVFGPALLIVGFVFWVRRFRVIWRSDGAEAGMGRAGFMAIGLVAAHSLVDYPIRTAAIAAVVGMAGALMVASPAADGPSLHSRRRPRDASKRTIMIGMADDPDVPLRSG